MDTLGSMRRAVAFAASLLLGVSVAGAAEIDHAPWDGLLKQHVHDGLVDYDGVQTRRQALNDYLAQLALVDAGGLPTQEAKLAFWINAYNACVFAGVLDHPGISSVKQVKGFFDGLRYQVAGQSLTLNQIEDHGRALGDWRIHVGVVCASTSCPPLRSEAYVPDRITDQLDEQARQFLKNARHGLRLEDKTLRLSQIFKWYAPDFVPSANGPFKRLTIETLLPVIRPWLDPGVAEQLERQPRPITYLEYDWSLNRRGG